MPLQNTVFIKNSNIIRDKYVPVTDQDTIGLVIRKIMEKNASPSDFWATLGRQDDGSISQSWSGSIVCSKVGNNSFTNRGRKIREQAEQLAKLYSPNDHIDVTTVYEKFISLKNLTFSNTDPASRKLRMTITLDPGEHALTFLQHTDPNDTTSQEGVFEYILPESKDPAGKRNLLTYLFEVPSAQASVDGPFQTVIKVMTYQSVVTTESTLKQVNDMIMSFDTDYAINVFDKNSNKFISYTTPEDIKKNIDPTKKTLLFIHGTISSIKNSYGDLYDSGKKTSVSTITDNTWIQKKILGGGKYEQVLGFDHPSITDTPQQNAAKLFSMLAPVGSFTKTVDIVTSSRGGLVGKCVINAEQNIMKIDRAATVACANGVELLETGQALGRFFGMMGIIDGEPASRATLLLLQLVVKVVLLQPGIKAMRKNDDLLKDILSKKPFNKDFRYLPLCGNYISKNKKHPPEWRFVDLLISGAMKNLDNDWVVETTFQVVVPDGYFAYQQNATTYVSKAMDTTHLRYFYDPMNQKAKSRMLYYFHDTDDVRAMKNLPADF